MGKKFDTIIFDLGGVLYDIDIQRSVNAFAKLGLKEFDGLYSLKEQSLLFDELEMGVITNEEFCLRINQYSGLKLNIEEVTDAWNSLLIGIKPETMSILSELKKHYRLFLLSNTNEIHLECINKYMQNSYGIPDLSSLFEKTYYSCRLGMRKPSDEIYRFVMNDAGIKSGEALFIDDNKDNVEGGNDAGLHSILMPKGAVLKEFLSDKGLI